MSSTSEVLNELSLLCEKAPPEIHGKLAAMLQTAAQTVRAEVTMVLTARRLQAVALYGDRPERSETAIHFFERHYAALVASGEFYADDLRQHDPRLYSALSAYLGLRNKSLADVMPIRTAYRPGRTRKGQATRTAA